MKKLISLLFVNFLSFYILDALFENIRFLNIESVFIMGIVFALVNMTLKPILKLLSLPINIITLGLFSLVVNAAVLKIAFSLSPNAFIASFGTAFLASIVLSFVNSLIKKIIGTDD
ncbi:phage holin family protein [Peptoniphilus sp. MSJ-1]|uniref:Phage holin family protein n=1 Tax=Peptoniphilus ovalis TaxID=2841503 RepID=A0ABS6FEM5_9FIRM|nr:phage holin family protein [Peptoniphilus ovalis]MBU5668639.1 phage holin family protein [Peptoniphilus ovalis]